MEEEQAWWKETRTRTGKPRVRLPLACMSCRGRKTKCNGKGPCDMCQYHRRDCVFSVRRQQKTRARSVGNTWEEEPLWVTTSKGTTTTTTQAHETGKAIPPGIPCSTERVAQVLLNVAASAASDISLSLMKVFEKYALKTARRFLTIRFSFLPEVK